MQGLLDESSDRFAAGFCNLHYIIKYSMRLRLVAIDVEVARRLGESDHRVREAFIYYYLASQPRGFS